MVFNDKVIKFYAGGVKTSQVMNLCLESMDGLIFTYDVQFRLNEIKSCFLFGSFLIICSTD